MKLTTWLTLSSAVLIGACSNSTQPPATQAASTAPAAVTTPQPAKFASEQRIAAHMTFLADDALEGRDTGSQGHLIASQYIASNFQQLGLKPAAANGQYFQPVPLIKSLLVQTSPEFSFELDGKATKLAYPKQFTTSPSNHQGKVSVKDAELVFVGYGMVSKEFGIDDYQGLDVKGKIVVMLPGRHHKLPSEEAAHLGALKAKIAAEKGAIGIITINTPIEEKTRPYSNSLLYLHQPRIRWVHADGHAEGDYPTLKVSAYLDIEPAKALFAKAPVKLTDIYAQLEKKQSPAGFVLPGKVNFARESTQSHIQSQNVAAVLEGSDPTLKDEYIVVTAHSDHIGVGVDMRSKDRINNGLMDNAAGVAIMLETARLFSENAVKPKRSVLFVAVTGEEKGLLGADYFANNPVRPIEKLVGNVNIDMPVLLYPFADLVAFGANHSTLGETVARAAGQYGIKVSPDPMPEQAIFTRSDHYTLVKKGVPAVFLMTGFTSQDPKEKGSDVWHKFFASNYHKPTDDVAGLTKEYGKIRYDMGALFADINFAIGMDIANATERPMWKKDSFFGKLLGQDYNTQK